MSDTINIPVELYDDLVKVVNRLKACSNRSSANKWAAETSLKEGRDAPKPPSKKAIIDNELNEYIDSIKL